jgi:flagellar assembly factor FliW
MQLQTTRFGTIEYAEEDVLVLNEGLIGLPACRNYLVLSHKENSLFRWLQSIEEPALAFLLLDPAAFAPNYAPQLPAAAIAALGLTEETPRIVFAIVSIPAGCPQEMTANLAGPIVINAEARVGAQIVLDDETWTTRHRVFDPSNAVVTIEDSKIAA